MAKAKIQGTTIPKHEFEALAAVLYPTLKEFYESPEGQAQFKAWQEQAVSITEDSKHKNEG